MSMVVSVENVCKSYRLGSIGGATLKEDFARWWARHRGRPDPLSRVGENHQARHTGEEFWALRDMSFQVKEGEILGVIGRNGAGKSTLLKILSQVTSPTSGEIKIRGRIASLLEVGTGFHPELTGRENIFLNGAILGMTKAEIRRKFDEIVAFSGIEEFIDTPVKRYSSGMYVRLAFAVAAHLEPEILIVDEVLAVGDAEFQKKCLGKMNEVSRSGRTVLLVSHNMDAIQSLCSSCIVLSEGQLNASGPTDECISSYLTKSHNNCSGWQRDNEEGKSPLLFKRVQTRLKEKQPKHVLEIEIEMESIKAHAPALLAFDILDPVGSTIMQALPRLEPFIVSTKRIHRWIVKIDLLGVVPGRYSLTLWTGSHNTHTYDLLESILSFEITNSPSPGRIYPHTRDHGAIVPFSEIIDLP